MRKTTLKLTAVRINGKRFFQVISPRPGGGRIRHTFKDQTEAAEHYKLAEKQISAFGAAAMLITDTLRSHAIKKLSVFAVCCVGLHRFAAKF